MDPVESLIGEIRRNPGRQFTEGELKQLAAVADREVWAAKALMLAHARAGRRQECVPLLEHILRLEPSAENSCNLAVGLRDAGRHQDACRKKGGRLTVPLLAKYRRLTTSPQPSPGHGFRRPGVRRCGR